MPSARSGRYQPVGYQQITNVAAAVGVTVPAAGDGKACAALIQAETQNIRWRDDGTNPTAAVGNLLVAGGDMWYEGDLNAIKFIEVAASAKVNVNFFNANVGL